MAEYDPIVEKAKGTKYEPIIPRIREWPIAKLYANRRQLTEEVTDFAQEQVANTLQNSEDFKKEIARAYYLESQRIRKFPWKVDKKDEPEFWDGIKNAANEADSLEQYHDVSRHILERYSNEIAGTFSPRSYHFAKRFLSFGFASLLNAFQTRNIKAIFDHKIFIQDRIKIIGHTEHLRKLAQKGTVILVPTHFSNLDSIIVGWSLHALGLPAFIYGAGLNLFNVRFLGYFMNRLGAYKLDRRKKNMFYLQTLKAYSTVALNKGAHSLFFPGGTRSRSGALEDHLKLGLLGTTFEAQRINIEKHGEKAKKLFVVPLIMSYHFVLEAKSLVKNYLKQTQTEKYFMFKDDEFRSKVKVSKFILNMASNKSDIFLSYGRPMDIFGNDVDENGDSISTSGRKVDIANYFISDGKIKKDPQRDNIYTQQLGARILQSYRKYNIVLSSHFVAFVTYRMLLNKYHASDVYELTDASDDKPDLQWSEFAEKAEKLVQKLKHMEQQEVLMLSTLIREGSIEEIIKDGVKNVGIFHNSKAVAISKENKIISEDLDLLYYYHNRLTGYGLGKLI